MKRSIIDLFKDALESDDYKFKAAFLVGSLVSYESNDTPEKEVQSTEYLTEILGYLQSVNSKDSDKEKFINSIMGTIERYLNWEDDTPQRADLRGDFIRTTEIYRLPVRTLQHIRPVRFRSRYHTAMTSKLHLQG